MLKCHQFVRSLWASYGVRLVEMCTWGSQAQPLSKIQIHKNKFGFCHCRIISERVGLVAVNFHLI